MYVINAIHLWFKRRIDWRTLLYALRERPIAVAGKGGYYQVDPVDLHCEIDCNRKLNFWQQAVLTVMLLVSPAAYVLNLYTHFLY